MSDPKQKLHACVLSNQKLALQHLSSCAKRGRTASKSTKTCNASKNAKNVPPKKYPKQSVKYIAGKPGDADALRRACRGVVQSAAAGLGLADRSESYLLAPVFNLFFLLETLNYCQ